MTEKEWVDLAKRRIRNILYKRLYANIRQLETKISEAGPNNQRAQPHIITNALKALERSNLIDHEELKSHPRYYFMRRTFDPLHNEVHANRRQEVQELQSAFTTLSGNQSLCGDALEKVVWGAINQSNLYTPFGSMAKPLDSFGGITIPGYLDFTLLLKGTNCLVIGEVKNKREWFYPANDLLIDFLRKAVCLLDLHIPILPVFIGRRIHQTTLWQLSSAGILSHESMFQYFDPQASEQLERIKHKDGLGFHDIKTDLTPPPPMLKFFSEIIPQHAKAYSQLFQSNRRALEQVVRLKDFKVFNQFEATGTDDEEN